MPKISLSGCLRFYELEALQAKLLYPEDVQGKCAQTKTNKATESATHV